MAFGRFRGRWIPGRIVMVLASAGIAGALLTGCGGDKDIDITKLAVQTDPPDVLFNEGLANMKAGHFSEASRKFAAVDKQHPYSKYAQKAILMNAWVNYRSGKYVEAVNGGRRYLNLYPTSDDAAYAQYIIGLSYYRQIPDVTRDQATAKQTVEAMNELVNRYPDSQYVPDAQEKIRFARDQLAGKDMQVGRYYQERKDYLAAVNRFREVVEKYPNTRQVEEALARLVECYFALGITNEAQAAAAVLGHNFPDSQWYKDSYDLLQTKGLKPRENAGSWLAGIGKTLIGAPKDSSIN